MNYMLLIYTPETVEAELAADPATLDAYMAEYNTFTRETRERGAFVAGEALHDTRSATTVRVRNGKLSATDGPFAETKEQLAGYCLLEARDLNEAIQLASKLPPARYGGVEVRPVREMEETLVQAAS